MTNEPVKPEFLCLFGEVWTRDDRPVKLMTAEQAKKAARELRKLGWEPTRARSKK